MVDEADEDEKVDEGDEAEAGQCSEAADVCAEECLP